MRDLKEWKHIYSRSVIKGQTPEAYLGDLLSAIDDKIDKESHQALTADLSKKVSIAREMTKIAMQRSSDWVTAIAFTGGKDSTLMLWLVRDVLKELGMKWPHIFFIDEGDVFPEIMEFVEHLSKDWGFNIDFVHNSDVSSKAAKLGDKVAVASLNEQNRKEIIRLGYKGEFFDYEPESYVGNHLMKTVAMNTYLEEHKIDCFFEGIRWDEQEARAHESYFSPRAASEFCREHVRVFPILHFKERDVWDAIHEHEIPYCSLYTEGYRSLGARCTTTKTSDLPAWEQDLEATVERSGRRQDKEGLMKKLRDLGYM